MAFIRCLQFNRKTIFLLPDSVLMHFLSNFCTDLKWNHPRVVPEFYGSDSWKRDQYLKKVTTDSSSRVYHLTVCADTSKSALGKPLF